MVLSMDGSIENCRNPHVAEGLVCDLGGLVMLSMPGHALGERRWSRWSGSPSNGAYGRIRREAGAAAQCSAVAAGGIQWGLAG